MLNFIIYEDNINMQRIYESAICEFIGGTINSYTIKVFNKFDENTIKELRKINGMKIYIIDIEVPGKSGLDLARLVRESGDWTSQIILITQYEYFKEIGFTGKMLALDFISKVNNNVKDDVKESLRYAYDILNTGKFLSFQYNGEIYHIPYRDILFIEKDASMNYCNIITKANSFRVKESLSHIEKAFEGEVQFFKSHRSCIVNIHNIRSLNLNSGKINFGLKYTYLLAREKKKALKDRLIDSELVR